jgi:hypothetical protein
MSKKGFWVLVSTASTLALVIPPPAAAQTCEISGTPGSDNLVGTENADVICARGGKDRVVGEAARTSSAVVPVAT